MKSNILKLSAAAVLLMSSSVVGVPRHTVEYKCHFILVDGAQTVRYISGNTKSPAQFQQSLRDFIYAKDGKTRLAIKKVAECVKADRPFRSYTARELDKKTLS